MVELNICFVDYVYPYACGDNRWAIIDILQTVIKKYTGGDVGMVCIPSGDSYNHQVGDNIDVIQTCVAFTGVESTTLSQLSNQDLVITGPVYNYSRDFVIPVSVNNEGSVIYSGWGFINALDWSVWAVLFLVMLTALGIQVLMKYMAVDASPGLTKKLLPKSCRGQFCQHSVIPVCIKEILISYHVIYCHVAWRLYPLVPCHYMVLT